MHDKSGYYYKKLRQKWGLPSILLPVTMAPISAVFAETNWIKYVNMVSFVSVTLLSGVDSFFSFASRKEKHFNHSCRYAELSTFIDSEMFKKKAFRVQADVFLTEVRMKLDTLTTTAPTIPQFILTHQMNTEKFAEIVEILCALQCRQSQNAHVCRNRSCNHFFFTGSLMFMNSTPNPLQYALRSLPMISRAVVIDGTPYTPCPDTGTSKSASVNP